MDLLQVGFGLRSKARGKLMWKKSAKQLVELTEGDSDRHFYQHFPSLIWKYGDRTLEKKKGGRTQFKETQNGENKETKQWELALAYTWTRLYSETSVNM